MRDIRAQPPLAAFIPPFAAFPFKVSPVSVKHRQTRIVGLRFRFVAAGSPADCAEFGITDRLEEVIYRSAPEVSDTFLRLRETEIRNLRSVNPT